MIDALPLLKTNGNKTSKTLEMVLIGLKTSAKKRQKEIAFVCASIAIRFKVVDQLAQRFGSQQLIAEFLDLQRQLRCFGFGMSI